MNKAPMSFNAEGVEGVRTHGAANAMNGAKSAPIIVAATTFFVEKMFFI